MLGSGQMHTDAANRLPRAFKCWVEHLKDSEIATTAKPPNFLYKGGPGFGPCAAFHPEPAHRASTWALLHGVQRGKSAMAGVFGAAALFLCCLLNLLFIEGSIYEQFG
jgi:hypothetical protein